MVDSLARRDMLVLLSFVFVLIMLGVDWKCFQKRAAQQRSGVLSPGECRYKFRASASVNQGQEENKETSVARRVQMDEEHSGVTTTTNTISAMASV